VGRNLEKLNQRIAGLEELLGNISGRIEGMEKKQKDTLAALGRISNKVNDMARDISRTSGNISKARITPSKKPLAPASTKVAQKPVKASPVRSFHIVKEGDNLYRISVKTGVSVKEIQRLNNLSNNNIRMGQKLYLKP